MKTGRGRVRWNGKTMEQRVYRWMCGRGEVKVQELRAGMKLTYHQAAQALNRLCNKGCMERLGANHWYRRFKATDIAPDDLRGTAPASLDALRAGMQKPKRIIPKPKPATALEEAWGFLPVPKVAAANETCCNSGSLPATISSASGQESEAA